MSVAVSRRAPYQPQYIHMSFRDDEVKTKECKRNRLADRAENSDRVAVSIFLYAGVAACDLARISTTRMDVRK